MNAPADFVDPKFFVDVGVFYVSTLRDLAAGANVPEELRTDWELLEQWLNCGSGPFTPGHVESITVAWRAYLAIGLAPSENLQSVFDLVSANLKRTDPDCKRHRPPTEVMDVFDRMLATRPEIEKKRAADTIAESERIKAALGCFSPVAPRQNYWRRQSQEFRRRAFASAVWAALTLILFIVFDPLDFGPWDSWRDDELMQVAFVMSIPLLIWVLQSVYARYVK